MGEGTGLGLATVYGIVQQNSGFITVVQRAREGHDIQAPLPPRGRGPVDVTRTPAVQEPRGRGETVLLVEDDPGMLEVGRRDAGGPGLRGAHRGRPASGPRVAQAHAGEIHLLVTDVVMPEMNGRDLAHRLAEIRSGIPCLFVSGYTADVIAHRGVLDEGVRFLQKPFSRLDLALASPSRPSTVSEGLRHSPRACGSERDRKDHRDQGDHQQESDLRDPTAVPMPGCGAAGFVPVLDPPASH